MSDFKVALCCIGRGENQYAAEFVEHYKMLGFDKIFIYDNNYDGEEYFDTVLYKYVSDGLVEITDFRNKEKCQLEAYEDCYRKHHKEYKWIAFFDFDEFLTIDKDIHDFVKDYDKFQCILVNWMIMDDNGQVYNTRRPLKERFTRPMAFDKKCGYDFPENNHVKSIVKSVRGKNEISFANPHIPSTPLKCCNALGKRCDQMPWQPYNFDVAYLRHYQYKTASEWGLKKWKRGMPDQTLATFKQNTPLDNFYRVNEKTPEKDAAMQGVSQRIIVSMTTIPSRKKRLMDNLPSLINQSYEYSKLVINVDDNLSDDDYQWYEDLKKLDARIEINKAESKWRSCNKLLPTLKKYPNDIIITLDDDVYYPRHTVAELIREYISHPDCIIAHEINPIRILKDSDAYFVTYVNGYDVMLRQVEWGKYLSNCALFPPYTFDGTDLYDYDKMMECTNGTHDELWFWVNSTLNNVQCIGLNYVRSFAPEMLEAYKEGEYCLSAFNNQDDKIQAYMEKINALYCDRLIANILSKQTVFTINQDNVYSFMFLYPYIKSIYTYGARVDFDKNLTKGWTERVIAVINGARPSI